MKLHEEYIQRHNLNVPVFCYDCRSDVFLKTKNSPHRWAVFHIIWRQKTSRPGFFEFMRMEPLHNGHGALSCFDKENYVYWDCYQTQIMNIVSSYKEDGFYAVSGQEKILMAWEMLLYMYDDVLAKRISSNDFYFQVEKSIDSSMSVSSRISSYKNALRILSESSGVDRIMDVFNFQLMPMARWNSKWLEDLFNG